MATTYATKQVVYFSCYCDLRLGAIALNEGESIKAVSDGTGYFYLYVEWMDGCLGRYTAEKVNELAGKEVVQ